jgi:hypothetical protein
MSPHRKNGDIGGELRRIRFVPGFDGPRGGMTMVPQ